MSTTKYIQTNLTSGVFSKKMRGRIDLQRYYNAADTIRNFLPLVQGGVTRRPGWHFIDYPKYNDRDCILIPFEYGIEQAYVIEVGDEYMRFYKDQALIRIESGDNLIVNGEFTTNLDDWTDYSVSPGTVVQDTGMAQFDGGDGGIASIGQAIVTELGQTYLLRFDVVTDNIYLRIGITENGTEIFDDVCVVPGLQRQTTFIARGTTTYIQFFRAENGPVQIDNMVCKLYDPLELTTSPYVYTELADLRWAQDSNNLYITHPDHWPIEVTRTSDTDWSITTIDNTQFKDGPYFPEEKTPTIVPSGIAGTITMVASAALWDTSTPSKHIGALWRLGRDTSGQGEWHWMCVRITSVENSTHCHATVLPVPVPYSSGIAGYPQTQREGRWSTLRGYPRSVVFHEGRLIFGGSGYLSSPSAPQTFYGSVPDDPFNMAPTDEYGTVSDGNAIQFTIGSNKVNLIRWLISSKGLVLGTNGGVFRATTSPMTPSDIGLVNDISDGVSAVQGIRIGPSIIFVERGGCQVLEATYNYSSDSYESQDLSVLADDLFDEGIIDMVYQARINPTVWFIKDGGNILALTYRRNEKVASWSEHITDGVVEDMTVSPNPTERWDDVYGVIKRTIDGVPTKTIEYLDPYINVDCGLSASFSNPVSILSGLEHLIGEIVDIVGDGAVYPQAVVDANGQLIIDPPASNIEVGLHYDSYLKTLKPEIKSDQGTIQSCKKKWSKLYVRLVDTIGLILNGEIIPFRSSLDLMDTGLTPFTGDKEILNMGWEDDGVVTIEQKSPLPATILCIFGTLEIN
jgi:hypothetical protein